MDKVRLVYASSLAAIINAVFVTAITILADLNAPLKTWLASLSGHHWTSKSILSLILYILSLITFYLIFKNVDVKKIKEALGLAVVSAVLGSVLILTFYTAHNFGLF